ncbi:MAG: DNA polymerase III subunit chi [Gammaproteobacteria bacterium]|nr:DNA polymerase III subunit chi [Gammaproteobacteria bacterium]
MARVDFYVLAHTTAEDRNRYACTLAEKAWHEGHRVYIHASSLAEAEAMDQLLWTFKDIAFLPHELVRGHEEQDVPILVGCGEHAPEAPDLMINLSHPVPAFVSRFSRIIELVDEHGAARERARDRYRFYREQGHTLHNHTIDSGHE